MINDFWRLYKMNFNLKLKWQASEVFRSSKETRLYVQFFILNWLSFPVIIQVKTNFSIGQLHLLENDVLRHLECLSLMLGHILDIVTWGITKLTLIIFLILLMNYNFCKQNVTWCEIWNNEPSVPNSCEEYLFT